jgi:hypothetical protein
MEGPEAQVLELPLDLEDPQAVGQRRVDLQGLDGLGLLLPPGHGGQRPHVVQPIGQLDDQDPDVPGHGHDHLSDVLRLFLLPAPVLDPFQLGQAVDDGRHLVAELPPDSVQAEVGILHHVVEQGGLQGGGIHPQVGQDVGHPQGVVDERLAGLPELALVRIGGEFEGPLNLPDVGLRVVGPDLAEKAVQALGLGRPGGDEREAREQATPTLRCLDLLHATASSPRPFYGGGSDRRTLRGVSR